MLKKRMILTRSATFSFQIIGFICLGLLRHYLLSFGGSTADTQSFHDRDLFGKICIGGAILVSLPTLLAFLLGHDHVNLSVSDPSLFADRVDYMKCSVRMRFMVVSNLGVGWLTPKMSII